MDNVGYITKENVDSIGTRPDSLILLQRPCYVKLCVNKTRRMKMWVTTLVCEKESLIKHLFKAPKRVMRGNENSIVKAAIL